MVAKGVAVVLAVGAGACALLALRQQRLQAAHELTQAQIRIREMDERLWLLRARIAQRVTPEHVHAMAASMGRLRPMIDSPALSPEPTLARIEETPAGEATLRTGVPR